MKHKMGLRKILQTIHPYPTWAEANKYAAGQYGLARKPEGFAEVGRTLVPLAARLAEGFCGEHHALRHRQHAQACKQQCQYRKERGKQAEEDEKTRWSRRPPSSRLNR